MEDDLLLGEQIKKKKRLVLLLLLTLLVVTAVAAALLEPTSPAPPAVAGVETPTQPATPKTGTPVYTPTPSDIQGDEWTQPTPPSPQSQEITSQAATPTAVVAEISQTVTGTHQVSAPTATSEVNDERAEASVGATPEHNGEFETTPPAIITPEEGTAIAKISPTIDSTTQATTPSSTKATPTATEISKRVHESWDVLDEDHNTSDEAVNASISLTPTTTLSDTSTLSETVAIVPPDGLPITGIITRQGMNWAALAMVMVLLGAGIIALLYPKLSER